MVAPLPHRLDPTTVTALLVGGTWLAIRAGSFNVGTLRLGGEAIRNEIWFTAAAAEEGGAALSGPFAAIQAVRHELG